MLARVFEFSTSHPVQTRIDFLRKSIIFLLGGGEFPRGVVVPSDQPTGSACAEGKGRRRFHQVPSRLAPIDLLTKKPGRTARCRTGNASEDTARMRPNAAGTRCTGPVASAAASGSWPASPIERRRSWPSPVLGPATRPPTRSYNAADTIASGPMAESERQAARIPGTRKSRELVGHQPNRSRWQAARISGERDALRATLFTNWGDCGWRCIGHRPQRALRTRR